MCIATNEVTALTNQPEGSKYSNEKAERLADIVETLLEKCTYVRRSIYDNRCIEFGDSECSPLSSVAVRYLAGLIELLGISVFDSQRFTPFLEKLHKGTVAHIYGIDTPYFVLVDPGGIDAIVDAILVCLQNTSLAIAFCMFHARLDGGTETIFKLLRVLRR